MSDTVSVPGFDVPDCRRRRLLFRATLYATASQSVVSNRRYSQSRLLLPRGMIPEVRCNNKRLKQGVVGCGLGTVGCEESLDPTASCSPQLRLAASCQLVCYICLVCIHPGASKVPHLKFSTFKLIFRLFSAHSSRQLPLHNALVLYFHVEPTVQSLGFHFQETPGHWNNPGPEPQVVFPLLNVSGPVRLENV